MAFSFRHIQFLRGGRWKRGDRARRSLQIFHHINPPAIGTALPIVVAYYLIRDGERVAGSDK